MLLHIKVKPNSSKSKFDEKNSLAFLKASPEKKQSKSRTHKALSKTLSCFFISSQDKKRFNKQRKNN
jgi:hypothetical protein